MEKRINVIHCSVRITAGFDNFTANLEVLAGRIGKEDFEYIALHPNKAKGHLETLGGFEDLIIFGIQEHGQLLKLAGQKINARQYIIGNPLIALSMTRVDVRAALYAPLRILIYEESEHELIVEYDKPSSLFGQFNNEQVTAIGKQLDIKLIKLLDEASKPHGDQKH